MIGEPAGSEPDGSDGFWWGEVPEPPDWLVAGLSSDGRYVDPSRPTLLDVLVNPDDAMAWAVDYGPGAEVAAVLATVDRERLSEKGRTDLLVAVGARRNAKMTRITRLVYWTPRRRAALAFWWTLMNE